VSVVVLNSNSYGGGRALLLGAEIAASIARNERKKLYNTNKKYYSFLYQNTEPIHILASSPSSGFIVKHRGLKGRGQVSRKGSSSN